MSETNDDETPSKAAAIAKKLGAVLADEAVNAIGIITIGYMATSGVVAYEPIAAIASIALGTKYIGSKK